MNHVKAMNMPFTLQQKIYPPKSPARERGLMA